MKVILKENIKSIGKKDEIINVSDGYARNYLFVKNLAVEATNSNLAKLKSKKESEQYKKNTEKEEEGYNYKYYLATGENDEHYQIQLGIKNYYPDSSKTEDLIKQVKVRVFYSNGTRIKDIDIGMEVQNN